MNRRRADTVVGVLLVFVLLAGGAFSWQAYQQRRAIERSMGTMMDSSLGTMHGLTPLWYVVGTLFVVSVIGSLYYLIRDEFTDSEGATDGKQVDPDSPPAEESTSKTDEDTQETSINPESNPEARVLDLLPDDERRVLEPVLNSPGVTQIELRDRSDFSKSKVSQTVSSLEERGLLYRERQGRTYRIYPSDDLRHQQAEQ
jgi:DNA-binding transcriptional ArsR family regulator